MRNSKGIPNETVHYGLLFSEGFRTAAGALKPRSDNAAETLTAWSFFQYDCREK